MYPDNNTIALIRDIKMIRHSIELKQTDKHMISVTVVSTGASVLSLEEFLDDSSPASSTPTIMESSKVVDDVEKEVLKAIMDLKAQNERILGVVKKLDDKPEHLS